MTHVHSVTRKMLRPSTLARNVAISTFTAAAAAKVVRVIRHKAASPPHTDSHRQMAPMCISIEHMVPWADANGISIGSSVSAGLARVPCTSIQTHTTLRHCSSVGDALPTVMLMLILLSSCTYSFTLNIAKILSRPGDSFCLKGDCRHLYF